jgi:hypothetical protein
MSLENKWRKKIVCNFTSLDTKWGKKKKKNPRTCNFTLLLQALGPIGYDCYRSLWNKLEKKVLEIYYVHFRPLYSIGRAYRHITQRFRSRTPRRYCHLITLVTSVYRKTNVFLTTVGTATPPGGENGWMVSIGWGCLCLTEIDFSFNKCNYIQTVIFKHKYIKCRSTNYWADNTLVD